MSDPDRPTEALEILGAIADQSRHDGLAIGHGAALEA